MVCFVVAYVFVPACVCLNISLICSTCRCAFLSGSCISFFTLRLCLYIFCIRGHSSLYLYLGLYMYIHIYIYVHMCPRPICLKSSWLQGSSSRQPSLPPRSPAERFLRRRGLRARERWRRHAARRPWSVRCWRRRRWPGAPHRWRRARISRAARRGPWSRRTNRGPYI